MARKRTILGLSGAGLLTLALILLGVFQFVNRGESGQVMALDYALGKLEGSIAAQVSYSGVRSRALTRGLTLYGLQVTGLDGRPFLAVDSLQTTYHLRSFLAGNVELESLALWGPHLTLSRYPGEDELNAVRILSGGGEVSPADAPAPRVVLHQVHLMEGTVQVLQPLADQDSLPERASAVTVPGVEGRLQQFVFEGLQASLPEVVVSSPDEPGTRVAVDSLSMVGKVYEDPIVLTRLQGQVSWRDGTLEIGAEEISLPSTHARGHIVTDLAPEEGAWVVDMELEASSYAMEDFQWLLPDLPEGEGEGNFTLHFTDRGDVRFGFEDATLVMDGSRLAGSGSITSDGELALDDVRVEASPLALARVRPFLDDSLPLSGTLQGRLTLNGPLTGLSTEGSLTLREPGQTPSTASFSGILHLGGAGLGVTDLEAVLDPLDYGLLAKAVPGSQLQGMGRAEIRATGSLKEGLRFHAELQHAPEGLPSSQLLADGSVRSVDDDYTLDLQADLSPLSLTTVSSFYPGLPLRGEVAGTVRALGPLGDLQVTTNLQTEAGRLALETRFDAREPGTYYRAEGELNDFLISRLVPDLPEATVFTGAVEIEGRGMEPETASVDATLRARASRVGGLDVDSATVALRVRDGAFHVDTLEVLAGGIDIRGQGSLAMQSGGPAGEVHVSFASDSLGGLRPILMGRDIVARDTVEAGLARAIVEAQGIDPDTLPSLEEVTVEGRLRGEMTLSGSLESFSARGTGSFQRLRYGTSSLGGAEVTFSATRLPGLEGNLQARVVADSLDLGDRAFQGAAIEVAYTRPRGTVSLVLTRGSTEDYSARARFQLDSLGGSVGLDELTLRFDSLRWHLERPSLVSWNQEGLRVDDLSLVETGGQGVRLVADGTLPRGDERADFTLDVNGLGLEQVARLLQLEEGQMRGTVALSLRVQGTADAPSLEGTLQASGLRYDDYGVERVEGEVTYAARRLGLELHAHEGDLEVLHATGTLPANLAFREVDERFPDEEIDLEVVADSLPAALASGLLPDLEAVQGTLAGRFQIGGTLQNPSPSGQLLLQNAAATVVPVGVRYSNVTGTLDLLPDGTLDVDASAEAEGTAHVTGTVKLEPLSNPTLDLEIELSSFLGIDRRDMLAALSGVVTLTGTYERPLIRGVLSQGRGLRVDRGILYVEEFARAASVVDLADPRFASLLDEDLLRDEPVVQERPNPFMQNLRVDVDLSVAQDSWLRSDEMNVAIGGDLKVTYSRADQRVVMLGELRAIRGDYSVLGRRFQVREGTVEFLGIPGVNPNLDIQADTRVRRPGEQALTVTASVTGTLEAPRVELSSDETGVAPSDLVSYLIFGRPTYQLGSGEQAFVTDVEEAAKGVAGSVLSGVLVGRLSAALARLGGLDYFAITQVGSVTNGTRSAFSQTQVELGQYVNDNVFLGLALQPWATEGTSGGSWLDRFGLRMEWTPTDLYTLQAFWEDRFLRSRPQGFQETFGSTQKILGLFVFSEWGY